MPRLLPAILLAIAFCTASAFAQTAPSLAADGLSARIAHLTENDDANPFEIGMLEALRSVEITLQTGFREGIGAGVGAMPIFRLGSELAPDAGGEPPSPETYSELINAFDEGMIRARTALARARNAGVEPFVLDLNDIWFDIDADGLRGSSESAVPVLGPLVAGRGFSRGAATDEGLIVRFDAADEAWLTAYTHLLSGIANLYLTFDPTAVIADLQTARSQLANAPTIPSIYDDEALRAEIAELEAMAETADQLIQSIRTELSDLNVTRRSLVERRNALEDGDERSAVEEELSALEDLRGRLSRESTEAFEARRLITREVAAAQSKITSGAGEPDEPVGMLAEMMRAGADTLYVVIRALEQDPDAARLRAAVGHWRDMIEENQRFWRLLAEETDNDREWVPNPAQVSALGIEVPAEVAGAWQNILDDAEAVLDGNLLIPHPLLPPGHGISLPAYVADPVPLSPADWIHGRAAYPFAAKGPRISGQNWASFQRLTSGNAGGFALFFN